MPNKFPKFKKLEVSDLSIFKKYADASSVSVCELSFANLIAWKDFDHPEYTFINDNLCVRVEPQDETPFFLEPLGKNKLEDTVNVCMQHTGKMSRLSSGFVSSVLKPAQDVKDVIDHFDYVYSVKDMAELKGRKFDGKRNHIKRFVNNYENYRYIEFKKDMAQSALVLLNEWCLKKSGADSLEKVWEGLEYRCQRDAVARTFEHYEELGILGGALFVQDDLIGFVVGSALNKKVACIHFLYTKPSVVGAFQTVLNEACKKTFSGFELVNLEQDLGLAGLRKTKYSYHPLKIEKKFEIEI